MIGKILPKTSVMDMLIRLISVCLCFLFSMNVFAKQPSAEEFLANQNTIRVYVDNGPGYGDQSATISAMGHLRELGFTGKFEVIYGNVTSAKVSTLFNLPSTLPDIYEDTASNIVFIKMKSHLDNLGKNKITKVDLGITVSKGSSACGVALDDGLSVDENSLMCDNNANFFNTKTFIEFNPYFAKTEPTSISIFDQKHEVQQEDSWKKFYFVPATTLEQADNYLHKDPAGQAILAQKPGLDALMDGIWNKTINVLPVYGYTIQSDVCNQYGNDSGCFPGNILQVITAARYAQLSGTKEMHKPLVVPVFYNYEKDAAELLQLINADDWGKYEMPGAANARATIKQLSLRNAFTIANVSDATTNERIRALKPGDVMLLSLGPLPKIVFDGIYTHTDTNVLPQIREGAGSFNTLVQTGKTHFRCGSKDDLAWEMGYDLIDDAGFKAQLQKLYSANGFCDAMRTWQFNPNIYHDLGDSFIAAQDSNSPISKYFMRLKAEANKPDNDRVRYGIDGAIDLLNNSGVVPR